MAGFDVGGAVPDCLRGGGEMGALMRAHDWAATALDRSNCGPRASALPSVRTVRPPSSWLYQNEARGADLVLLDLTMPGMSGSSTAIRRRKCSAPLPGRGLWGL